MTYTEKELDQFLHGISLSLLSKKSAQHWRYDEETAKEIEWLEALERKVRADKADRKTEPQEKEVEWVYNKRERLWYPYSNGELLFKTENSSEKPNNCEDEPQTDLVNDSQVLVKDLVDDEFNPYDEECMRCKHLKLKCEFIPTYCKFESRDEPMETTDYCDICKRDMCEGCIADATNPYCVPSHYEIRYEPKTEPTISKMEQVDEPKTQTETQNSNLTFENRTMLDCYNCKRYKSDDACVECRYEPKADTPQTDCDKCIWSVCNYNKVDWDADTPQTDCGWK